MRFANIALNLMSLVLVVAGLALITTFFFGSPFVSSGNAQESSSVSKDEFNVPVLDESAQKEPAIAPAAPAEKDKEKKPEPAIPVPKDKTLRITIPKMARVDDTDIPYTTGDDEQALHDHTAIHLKGTGFPWEKEANVYIAGHRLGYLNTKSFLAFYDLNVLTEGDKIFITDSMGRRYVYKVFKDFVVDPSDVYITRPVKNKNIVTLQTCTLPDYSQRLIVQAERVA
ncbi:MAG TPA: class E sortase [Rubrobacteraceae bacterium]|nr:class E sortase [Rubrobacteraceae bacterium]